MNENDCPECPDCPGRTEPEKGHVWGELRARRAWIEGIDPYPPPEYRECQVCGKIQAGEPVWKDAK